MAIDIERRRRRSMFLTPDGFFEPTSGIYNDLTGHPAIDGLLIIQTTNTQVAELKRAFFNQAPAAPYPVLLGRSGHAQVGLELQRHSDIAVSFTKSTISIPILVRALGPKREPWLDSIFKLSRSGRSVKIGRVLVVDPAARLNIDKARKAISEKLVAFGGAYSVNDDGSFRVNLEPIVFIQDNAALSDPEAREVVLLHSRMALQKYQDYEFANRIILSGQSLVVTGIRFSSGPYPALIRPTVKSDIRHVQSGIFFDGFRTTRIGRRYGANGVRQIELFNESNCEYALGSDDAVVADLYEPLGNVANPLGIFASKASRTFFHIHGVPLPRMINLSSNRVQNVLFENIGHDPLSSSYYAKVFTPNGVSNIPWAATPKFQRTLTEKAIDNALGERELVRDAMSLSNSLRSTVDHARLFVSHTLPSAEELFWLHELGIRAFIFKDVMPKLGTVDLDTDANTYMDGHLHATIHQLSMDGLSFCQLFRNNSEKRRLGRQFRDFFKGFWCLDEAKVRSESVSTFINMYGWHRDELLVHSEAEVELLFRSLSKLLGPRTLAVMHGKGPGYMWLADKLARKLRLLSIGVGIDLEKLGQKSNLLPDFALDFWSNERAYRQKIMDQLGLIKIFNIGGYGTLEEIAITISSYKLFENVPAPIILVDESASKHGARGVFEWTSDHLWADLRSESLSISNISSLKYSDGRIIDISSTPLGPRWIANVIHCVSSYREAAKILNGFARDPIRYWLAADLTAVEVQLAWQNYLRRLDYYGFSAPLFLEKAVSELASRWGPVQGKLGRFS